MAHRPQHPLEHEPMWRGRLAAVASQWWQERGDPGPVRIGTVQRPGAVGHDAARAERQCLGTRPSFLVAPASAGLMLTTKLGPGEQKGPALRLLVQEQHEAPDLLGAQFDAVWTRTPFFCSISRAVVRITSSAA